MMKKNTILILIIICLIFPMFCLAEDGQNEGVLYKEYYENGNLSLEGVIVDGKKQGLFSEYDLEGRRTWERTYKNGILDGVCRKYYETGELNSDWRFRNGQPIGLAKEFYQDGKLLRRWDNRKIDKGIIILKEFYKNGKTLSESVFKDNRLISLKRYAESGKIILNENYERK